MFEHGATHEEYRAGRSARSPVHPGTWLRVEEGLWVAEPDGEFAGMIVQSGDGRFTRTDRFGHGIGLFASLEDAEQGA